MFITYTKNKGVLVENSDFNGRPLTWEDIPEGTVITAVSLTHPTMSSITNNTRISPKVNINKYHYYYFFNEAVFSVMRSTGGGMEEKSLSLMAKVIAGIDVEKEYILEVRLDKFGNTTISSYPLSSLVDKVKSGQMRRSIIKTGIDCPTGKKLL